MAVLISLFVAGCTAPESSSKTSDGGSSGTPTPAGKKLKIGVSIPAADHGWTAGVIWWAEQMKTIHPDVEWVITPADGPDKQIKDLETMMVQGVDGVVVLATESAPLTPIAKQIHERGILLINVDRGFLEPVADVFIEGDNTAFGRVAAEFFAEKLNGQGNIVMLEGAPSTVNTARVAGFREVMKAHPGIKILDSQAGEWRRDKALNVTQTMLLKHPQIDAIWAADDDMALGVEQALKEASRTAWIVGGGGMKDVVKRVQDGDPVFPATVTYPPSMIAVGCQQAVSILQSGKKDEILKFTPRHIKIECDLVTKENAARYYFPDSVY